MENEGESDLLQDHPSLQLTAAVLLKDHKIWEPLLPLCICMPQCTDKRRSQTWVSRRVSCSLAPPPHCSPSASCPLSKSVLQVVHALHLELKKDFIWMQKFNS